MRNSQAFFTSFLALIVHSRLSLCQPLQHSRSQEVRKIYLPQTDTYFQQNIVVFNPRIPNPDQNRGVFITSPSSLEPITRTERSRNFPKSRKCTGNFCEEVDGYPEDLIRRILSRTKNLDSYFKGAEVVFELNNRGAFDVEEDEGDTMCPTKSITTFPRYAKNVNNEDKFLVNVEGHKQGIISETCLENASCRFDKSFPSGYVSSCKQRFARRSLAILDVDNQTTAWDTFEVPSCCVCVIKRG